MSAQVEVRTTSDGIKMTRTVWGDDSVTIDCINPDGTWMGNAFVTGAFFQKFMELDDSSIRALYEWKLSGSNT